MDGPRGPLHRVKPGAILAAQQSGAALVPITARASRAWVFERAWDRYQLPKPFARVEIVRAAAIPVAGLAVEAAARELELALGRLDAA